MLLYPVSSWRDAPLFPTPAGALGGLAALAPLPADRASIVDAGCGVGDGLRELHREYANARIDGLEWSWPLVIVCAWRCRFARVRRADGGKREREKRQVSDSDHDQRMRFTGVVRL